MGGGELAIGVEIAMGSPALLSMATSLSAGLASLLLCKEVSFISLELSPLSFAIFSPPFHEGTSQVMPVKLLTWNGFRFHLRQGVPDRSRARRPALMAFSAFLGPSLGPAGAGAAGLTV